MARIGEANGIGWIDDGGVAQKYEATWAKSSKVRGWQAVVWLATEMEGNRGLRYAVSDTEMRLRKNVAQIRDLCKSK